MIRIYPNYYPRFHCIAGRCRHNCCVGWEIDIDFATWNRYSKMKGPMGDKLRQHMEKDGVTGHFALTEDDRCPLLRPDGLCELILEKGEKALCQICRDHPRFRLRLGSWEEVGLGLCCEEACRLILNQREPVSFYAENDGRSKAPLSRWDAEIIERRDHLLAIAQDRGIPISERFIHLMEAEHCCLPPVSMEEWARALLGLERMDEAWTQWLQISLRDPRHAAIDEITQEQLLVYFLYRHWANEWKCVDYALGVLPFCILSTQLVVWLCREPEDIFEAARMYSAEVEYSDENQDALLETLQKYNKGEWS